MEQNLIGAGSLLLLFYFISLFYLETFMKSYSIGSYKSVLLACI